MLRESRPRVDDVGRAPDCRKFGGPSHRYRPFGLSGGAPPTCEPPGPPTVVEMTATAVSLSWSPGTNAGSVQVGLAGRQYVTDGTSLRVGGLRPDCTGACEWKKRREAASKSSAPKFLDVNMRA